MNAEDLLVPSIEGVDLRAVFDSIQSVNPDDLVAKMKAHCSRDYSVFLSTSYWQSVAFVVKDRDGNRCKICNSSKFLNAHHRHYKMSRGTEHLHLVDLTTLCRKCHELFHGSEGGGLKIITAEKPKRGMGEKAFEMEKRRIHKAKKARLKNVVSESVPPIPTAETFVMTREHLEQCKTNGSFTRVTLDALGISDLSKGWSSRLVGTLIRHDAFASALNGRGQTIKKLRQEKSAAERYLDESTAIAIEHGKQIALTDAVLNGLRASPKTIELLGTSFRKGWKKRLHGKVVSWESFTRAVNAQQGDDPF